LVELAERERFEFRIAPVAKRLGGATVRMLAYNGSIPGPVLKVGQGSTNLGDAGRPGPPTRRARSTRRARTVSWSGSSCDERR
jgi:hypothetical protein